MLKIIIALAYIAHGIGHVMGFFEAWTSVPMGFSNNSWIFSNGTTIESPIGKVFGLVWLVAMVATVGAGYGFLINQQWWRPLAIAAAFLSLAVIVPWWNTVTGGVQLGALFDVLIIAALLPPWGDQVVHTLQGA